MTKSFEQIKEALKGNGDALFHAHIKVPRHIVKKNSRPIRFNRRTGQRFIGKSYELAHAEIRLEDQLRNHVLKIPGFSTITKTVWAVFLFYFPHKDFLVKRGDRKGNLSRRMPDLSNLIELPADCLQKAGIIENDHLICSLDLSRRLPGKEYALEIFLFEYEMPILSVLPTLQEA